MLYLTLYIAGNAAFALLVKVARTRRFDYPLAGFTNYATAAVVAVVALVAAGLPSFDGRAALFGLLNGAQYLTTFLLMYVLIGMAGIAVTTSFLRLSVAVPVIASILIWREWPSPVQALGLLLAATALPLLSSRARRSSPAAPPATDVAEAAVEDLAVPVEAIPLPEVPSGSTSSHAQTRAGLALLIGATILISGIGLLAAKAFAELGRPEQRPVYVAAVYVAATLLAAGAWPWRTRFRSGAATGGVSASAGKGKGVACPGHDRIRIVATIALGMLIGVVNLGQIWVLLPALEQIPGVIAFPVAAAGGLSLTALGGWLFWREPLGGRTGAGILLAILAATLANAK